MPLLYARPEHVPTSTWSFSVQARTLQILEGSPSPYGWYGCRANCLLSQYHGACTFFHCMYPDLRGEYEIPPQA